VPLRQQAQRARGVEAANRIIEELHDFAPQAVPADATEGTVAQRVSQGGPRAPGEGESQARGEPRGAQSPRRIVVKASGMQHPQPPLLQIGDPFVEIHDSGVP
jgi:hypothetical protein